MEAVCRRRGWKLTPLEISPPLPAARIDSIKTADGIKVPPQLGELLTQYSARVTFGWYVPPHLHSIGDDFPIISDCRDAVWDVDHIVDSAIPNFANWKKHLAWKDRSEAPNRPEMWENQFPFYCLINGDIVTIDVSHGEGPHPVRYFSHDLETPHGMALAPDLFTFITEMAHLGHASLEWATSLLGTTKGDTRYIKADSPAGLKWRAFLESDPAARNLDDPPVAVIEKTPADRALLDGARANDIPAVQAALAAGAAPDVVPTYEWRSEARGIHEFCTAISYAVRHDNVPMVELLLKHGATLNTRRLPLSEAIEHGRPETVSWLLANGARVNGWRGERYWPLHLLVTRRGRAAAMSRAEYEESLRKNRFGPVDEAEIRDLLDRQLDMPTYLAMLDALLAAGADPDPKWDGGMTMLMWSGAKTARVLLSHGANVNARDGQGWTAMHYGGTAEKLRLLVTHGADPNAPAEPKDEEDGKKYGMRATPLQHQLLTAGFEGLEGARTLIEVGADPRVRDGHGRNTLYYCSRVASYRLIEPYGLDPLERQPDGDTLLHNLVGITGGAVSSPPEVAYLNFLISLGLDINARNHAGRTMLHVAAERIERPADIRLLLDHGADKNIADGSGKRPVDLVPRSLTRIRELLT